MLPFFKSYFWYCTTHCFGVCAHHLPGEGWSQDADPHGAEVYRGGAQSVQTGTSSFIWAYYFNLLHAEHCLPVTSQTNKPGEKKTTTKKAQPLSEQDTHGWLKGKNSILFFVSFHSSSQLSLLSHLAWVVNRNVKLSALGCISRLAVLIVGPLCHRRFALHCHAAQRGGATKGWIVGAGPHQTCHVSDRLGSAVNAIPHAALPDAAQRVRAAASVSLVCQDPPPRFISDPSSLFSPSLPQPTLSFSPEWQDPFLSLFHLWLRKMTLVSVSRWWCHRLLWRDCPVRPLLCGSSFPAVACCLACRHTQKKNKKHTASQTKALHHHRGVWLKMTSPHLWMFLLNHLGPSQK